MAEVVTLSGDDIPNKPDEHVVGRLRDLLDEAEKGRVRGVAYVAIRDDGSFGTAWEGPGDTRHRISSGIAVLQARWTQKALIDRD